MANRLYPDFSSREALIDSVKAAGQYIVDHASNIVGEYPSLICGFSISVDFKHDEALSLSINRQHIVCDIEEYPQQNGLADTAAELYHWIDGILYGGYTIVPERLQDFKAHLESFGVDLERGY